MMDTNSSLEYAGFGVRLKAFAYDYLPIAAYIILLFGITMGFIRAMGALGRPVKLPENMIVGDLIAFLTLVLPDSLFHAARELPKAIYLGQAQSRLACGE